MPYNFTANSFHTK